MIALIFHDNLCLLFIWSSSYYENIYSEGRLSNLKLTYSVKYFVIIINVLLFVIIIINFLFYFIFLIFIVFIYFVKDTHNSLKRKEK